jgi:hypothetical protein
MDRNVNSENILAFGVGIDRNADKGAPKSAEAVAVVVLGN